MRCIVTHTGSALVAATLSGGLPSKKGGRGDTDTSAIMEADSRHLSKDMLDMLLLSDEDGYEPPECLTQLHALLAEAANVASAAWTTRGRFWRADS